MAEHYTAVEKAEVLAILKANDGNISKTSRETDISRKSIRKWKKNKDEILRAAERVQRLQEEDEELSDEEAETQVEHAKIGENYQLVKDHLAEQFNQITAKAMALVQQRMGELDPKDAMWVASVGMDKMLKLKGEPDQVIEVRNMVVHLVVDKLTEAVNENIIDSEQAQALSEKFDEIEEAEHEVVE